MDDVKLLEKLYDLRECLVGPVSETNIFVDKWIEDTKYAISLESAKTVGLGDFNKALKSLIKRASKKDERIGYVLSSSKKHRYVITDGEFVILMRNNYGLPTTDTQVGVADSFINYADKIRALGTSAVPSPTRYELDTIIECHKAQKKGRKDYPIYDFGDGLPKVRADILIDLKCIFDGATAYVDRYQGERSPILLKNSNVMGILFQENRIK